MTVELSTNSLYSLPPDTSSAGGANTVITPQPKSNTVVLDKLPIGDNFGSDGYSFDLSGLPELIGEPRANLVIKAIHDYPAASMQADMMAFLAIFQQIQQTLRTSNRESSKAETAAQVTALNAAADKIIEAAELRYDAAQLHADFEIAASSVSIGVSTVQVGMAGVGYLQSRGGARTTLEGEQKGKMADVETDLEARQTLMGDADLFKAEGAIMSARGASTAATSQAMTPLGGGISGIIKAEGDKKAAEAEKDASEKDAEGAKNQAAAKMLEAAAQTFADDSQAAQDRLKNVNEIVSSIKDAETKANSTIDKNI